MQPKNLSNENTDLSECFLSKRAKTGLILTFKLNVKYKLPLLVLAILVEQGDVRHILAMIGDASKHILHVTIALSQKLENVQYS